MHMYIAFEICPLSLLKGGAVGIVGRMFNLQSINQLLRNRVQFLPIAQFQPSEVEVGCLASQLNKFSFAAGISEQ